MTPRALIKHIVALEPAPRCGFWLGNPHPDSWPGLHRYFGTSTEEELRRKLGDDFRWISPSFAATTFPNAAAKGLLGWAAEQDEPRPGRPAGRQSRTRPAWRTSPGRIRTPWISRRRWPPSTPPVPTTGPRDSGRRSSTTSWTFSAWSPTSSRCAPTPRSSAAATDRVCGFYHAANERFFDAAGDRVDAYFFGNDFGTQLDLMISPGPLRPLHPALVREAHRPGPPPRPPGRPPLLRLDPPGHPLAHRRRRQLPPPAPGQGRAHGRGDAGPGFRRPDRLPGRGRHPARPAPRLARRGQAGGPPGPGPSSAPTSSSAPATKPSCPTCRPATSPRWPKPRPDDGGPWPAVRPSLLTPAPLSFNNILPV
ncbi:MAG: hypothetical protein MZV63_58845 [Marinilabiliales bacterium]|nr:hypothetical protein [Marinilabiliales bacterium]